MVSYNAKSPSPDYPPPVNGSLDQPTRNTSALEGLIQLLQKANDENGLVLQKISAIGERAMYEGEKVNKPMEIPSAFSGDGLLKCLEYEIFRYQSFINESNVSVNKLQGLF